MKINISKMRKKIWITPLLGLSMLFGACEKGLEYKTYGDLNSVVATPEGLLASINAIYRGMAGGDDWQGGWGSGTYGWRTQAMMTTDEGICAWGGDWVRMHNLNFTPDFGWVTHNYGRYLPYISRIAIVLNDIENAVIDQALKDRYIAELKALRAHYAQLLYFNYGPLTIITDATIAADPAAPPVPRPSAAEMVKQIEQDWKDAAAVLPSRFTGDNYGRFSKAAALTGLMKLYMQEKRWEEAVTVGQEIKTLGYSLDENYEDLFSMASKGGASNEMILAVVSTATGGDAYTNMWLAHALPTDYRDPSGVELTAWDGYKMRWYSYDKFDQNDRRLRVLLEEYPTGRDGDGNIIYKNARTAGHIGAVPVKFAPDPSRTSSQNSAVDNPVYRYADVLLMLAESINEANGGPNQEAYSAINDVRERAGLDPLPENLNKTQFLEKIQDERLFELWGEGWRRDDLIRWGLFIQRAIDDGASNVNETRVLFPLPRTAVNESNNVIKQNEGYQ